MYGIFYATKRKGVRWEMRRYFEMWGFDFFKKKISPYLRISIFPGMLSSGGKQLK